MIYQYDGSFEGLMSLFYYLIRKKIIPQNINNEDNSLLNSAFISTDFENSKKLILYLKKNYPTVLEKIFYAFLSEIKGFEKSSFEFLILTLSKKMDPSNLFSYTYVKDINVYYKKVTNDAHRYLGLIRFKELKDGTFFSSIKPIYNVIPLLTPHFINRFKNEKFILHDIKRRYIVMYDKKVEFMQVKNLNLSDEYHQNEIKFQNLWKTYHKYTAIEERYNLKLQNKFIPNRFWKYLIENRG
ncbi:hypothetical protein OSSY52_16970 [Tepiditoga spiralis]|uniref:DUF4130 domain-containing protein n=1 Tax=Tepiditoga spiralis TaxID=2108365 RepID=A0A7G1G827_9BACT|nr:TIGR03915 family putative DNA repair protein [Tepiditoga spiralis]BBE31556.1 hypothetical protein OSSY52_16970 [Tepiditoga spiralis]